MKGKKQVYAIVRVDADVSEIREKISIVKVVLTENEAESEVSRLDKLNLEKGSKYWWQATRLVTSKYENDFFAGKRSHELPYVINDSVEILQGEHKGKLASVISIEM